MEIRCPNCQKKFEADSEQESLVNRAIKNNQRLIFIECPECYKDVPINPNDLLSKEAQKDEDKKNKNSESIECPICHEGIVSYINNGDEQFWGCGECGNVWMSVQLKSKDELIPISNDLDEIVCVIDKIGSGFELTEDMAFALVLFFKERKVLDKLSRIRKFITNELSERMSSSEYDEWMERETLYWKPPYGMAQDELIQKIKEL